ncbi:N-acetyltransferase [Sinanaerobacter chloroacetimidivorans]|jgi:amino-acid N-acetyltransferase|uniref:N-acetyltransferase n=1 Tax=Sinanaerobacter chloroacetimidivorans TaxID=2818044 RepID=A0A8J7W1T1_9FIRM|nr:N-acetyltransferase [Sinanaerobacter chloroacetimidivorans]MBR0597350.1 N-acetyltransferase [Sinanaerobacter chloroacetimidivorans]
MNIRKARLSDTEAIHKLVNHYAKKSLMLPRSRSSIYEYIRNYSVMEIDNEIVGIGALSILWVDLAEIRTLAVKESHAGQGIGKKLVEHFLKEAEELGIKKVFTLTYQTSFFSKCGFKEISKEHMPHKVWKDCLNCPKFPNCDEVLMVFDNEETSMMNAAQE